MSSRLRTVTYDPNDPVVVRQYWAEPLAELDRTLLEAAGIEASIRSQSFLEVTGPPVSLVVRREDLGAAREELERISEDLVGDGEEALDEPQDLGQDLLG